VVYNILKRLGAGKDPYECVHPDMTGYESIFPFVEYAAVYRSGALGVGDRGSEQHAAAVNTTRLYSSFSGGWDPLQIVFARLGMGRELETMLETWPESTPLFSNGLVSDGPLSCGTSGPDAPIPLRTNKVRRALGDDHWWPLLADPFRHTGAECPSILACSMNESLLHSHDGVIRVAPAVSENRSARFTLHATGGFVVSSGVQNGKPQWVSITSKLGLQCRLENAWPRAVLYRDGVLEGEFEQQILEFPTRKGEIITVTPDQAVMEEWEVVRDRCAENVTPRTAYCGAVTLGLPRMF
jgi:alpha-L-fucosidase 2